MAPTATSSTNASAAAATAAVFGVLWNIKSGARFVARSKDWAGSRLARGEDPFDGMRGKEVEDDGDGEYETDSESEKEEDEEKG